MVDAIELLLLHHIDILRSLLVFGGVGMTFCTYRLVDILRDDWTTNAQGRSTTAQNLHKDT